MPVARQCVGRVTRSGRLVPIDLAQCTLWSCADRYDMKPSGKIRLGKVKAPPKRSRSKETRRIIEEYVDKLREIIKKLRQRLH